MKNDIIRVFPTLIGTYDMTDLVSKIDINRIVNGDSVDNSLVDGSRPTLIPHTNNDFSTIISKLHEYIDDFSSKLSIKPTQIYDSWINILRQRGSVGSHRHYGSVISGALYLQADEGSSSIYFVNPTEGYRMLEMGYVSSYESEYTPNIHCITPTTGQLILFPSWIEHYVGVNESSLRITMSFNTK
jgi:uncharacterized protein (TIGR02466 family)